MKKYDINYVKEFFLSNGCELISDIEVKSTTPINYRCCCGVLNKGTFAAFKQGRRCKECFLNRLRNQKKKHNFEYVKEYFNANGCVLMEEKYTNSITPMLYKCVCGNVSKITFGNFSQGQMCKLCGNKKIANKQIGEGNHRWNKDREIVFLNNLFKNKSKRILHNSLKALNSNKNDNTYKLLGYTTKELMDHITNHPNWHIVKNQQWHLDHIFPIKAFVEHNIKDLKIINALSNLQPLLSLQNLQKGANYDKIAFLEWLKENKYEQENDSCV